MDSSTKVTTFVLLEQRLEKSGKSVPWTLSTRDPPTNVLSAHLAAARNNAAKILLKDTHGKQGAENFYSMANYQVMERIRSPPAKPDLYSNLSVTPTEKRPNRMPLHEIVAACATMMDAGNDTRQTSLTNLMYPLSTLAA